MIVGILLLIGLMLVPLWPTVFSTAVVTVATVREKWGWAGALAVGLGVMEDVVAGRPWGGAGAWLLFLVLGISVIISRLGRKPWWLIGLLVGLLVAFWEYQRLGRWLWGDLLVAGLMTLGLRGIVPKSEAETGVFLKGR